MWSGRLRRFLRLFSRQARYGRRAGLDNPLIGLKLVSSNSDRIGDASEFAEDLYSPPSRHEISSYGAAAVGSSKVNHVCGDPGRWRRRFHQRPRLFRRGNTADPLARRRAVRGTPSGPLRFREFNLKTEATLAGRRSADKAGAISNRRDTFVSLLRLTRPAR